FHLDHRFDVVESGGQDVNRLRPLLAGLIRDPVERTIDNALGGRLLAVLHDDVHELGKHLVVEFRVRENRTDRSLGSTGHVWYPLGLRALRAVLGPALLALAHTRAVQRAANGVIAHAREILHATAADEHYRVLLKIVALTADVARYLVAIGQAHAADLDRKSTRLNSSHVKISYAVFCL